MKVFEYVCYIFMGLIVILAGCVLFCSANINDKGLVLVGGKIPLCVTGNSMEPFIDNNDLIIMDKVALAKYRTTNVVAYFTKSEKGDTAISIGRIINQDYDDEGNYIFTIKADASKNEVKILGTDMIGKWSTSRIPLLGGIFMFLFSQNGFILGIVTPFMLLVVFEIVLFIINNKKKKEKIEII